MIDKAKQFLMSCLLNGYDGGRRFEEFFGTDVPLCAFLWRHRTSSSYVHAYINTYIYLHDINIYINIYTYISM
jgi:hypothetical protein